MRKRHSFHDEIREVYSKALNECGENGGTHPDEIFFKRLESCVLWIEASTEAFRERCARQALQQIKDLRASNL